MGTLVKDFGKISSNVFDDELAAACGNPAAYKNAAGVRGNNLGSSFTAAQQAAILAGTFEGMWLGDYWVINGRTHTIVDFDPYWHVGDQNNGIVQHHVAIVSDGEWTSKWNNSNDTSSGYVGSAVRTYIKGSGGPQANIITDFGSDHVLSYRGLLPSTYSSGNASGWAWVDCRSELLSEMEVYGAPVWSVSGKGYEVGHAKRQLSLFRYDTSFVNTRAIYWLRSVYSATDACGVNTAGNASYYGASSTRGVRPLSLIA